MTCDALKGCTPSCEEVFSSVRVYPMVAGTTRVVWALKPTFAAAGPFRFLLQYSLYPVDEFSAWEDAGELTEDVYEAIDVCIRSQGNFMRAHYRVLLLDADDNQYTSRPTPANATFDFRQSQILGQVLRTEELRMRNSPNSSLGILLKRKTTGLRCTVCSDHMTNQVTDSSCETCYGTGFVGGYWRAADCSMVDFVKEPAQRSMVREPQGTMENQINYVRMLNIPQIFSNDVWIQQGNDHRYVIQSFASEIEIGSAAIVLQPVEFRLAEFSHIIYRFPL